MVFGIFRDSNTSYGVCETRSGLDELMLPVECSSRIYMHGHLYPFLLFFSQLLRPIKVINNTGLHAKSET